ncbi:hypothetical protein [Thiomonas sp. X19]|uniref:hypothetical protein n=1 Tax=Thiomonas sp. X19 TaxID=1050370 RepID=UPI001314550F|nr:hypothetical protein [Thiomonas sp. X19]
MAMTAALAQQPAQFSFPVIAPSVDGARYDLVAVQDLRLQQGPHRGTLQTTALGFVPAGAFAVAGHFPALYNRLGTKGHVAQTALRLSDILDRMVVTHSAASALAVNTLGSGIAIAALDHLNIRPVAQWALSQGKEVVILPDNSDLSRAAARDAARTLGERVKVASPPYQPGQTNILNALIDAHAHARGLYPSSDEVVFSPIADAKPWTPGMKSMTPARQLAAGIER